jgi:hypothetical protein
MYDGGNFREKDQQMVKESKSVQGKWRFPTMVKNKVSNVWSIVSNRFKEVDMKRLIIGLVMGSLFGSMFAAHAVPVIPFASQEQMVAQPSITLNATRDYLADAVVLGSCFCLGGLEFLSGNAPEGRSGKLARLRKNQARVNVADLTKRLVGEMGSEQLVGSMQEVLSGVGGQIESQNPTSGAKMKAEMINVIISPLIPALKPFVGKAAGSIPSVSFDLAVDRVAIDGLFTGMSSLWRTLSTTGVSSIPASQRDAARVTLLVIAMLSGYTNYGIDTVISEEDAVDIETVVEELGASLGSGAVSLVLTKLKNMLMPVMKRKRRKNDSGGDLRQTLGIMLGEFNKRMIPLLFKDVKSFNDILDLFALRGKLISKSAIADLLERVEQVWLQLSGRTSIAPASTNVIASDEEFDGEEELEEDDLDDETRRYVETVKAEKKNKGRRLGFLWKKGKGKSFDGYFNARLEGIALNKDLDLDRTVDYAEALSILKYDLASEGYDVQNDERFKQETRSFNKTTKNGLERACETVESAIEVGAYEYPTMFNLAAALRVEGYAPTELSDGLLKEMALYVDKAITPAQLKKIARKAGLKTSKGQKLGAIKAALGIDYRYFVSQNPEVKLYLYENLKKIGSKGKLLTARFKADMKDKAEEKDLSLAQLLAGDGWNLRNTVDPAILDGLILGQFGRKVQEVTSWSLEGKKKRALNRAFMIVNDIMYSNAFGARKSLPRFFCRNEIFQIFRAAGYKVQGDSARGTMEERFNERFQEAVTSGKITINSVAGSKKSKKKALRQLAGINFKQDKKDTAGIVKAVDL